jgi:penicillin-binding protein 1A
VTRRDELAEMLVRRHRRRLRLERVRRRRRAGVVFGGIAGGAIAVLVLAGFGTTAALSASCSLSSLRQVQVGQNSFVYAADGTLLGSIPADQNRDPVALAKMSSWLPTATIAIEDKRFYQHGGIDYVGIMRALWSDVSAGKVVQGGSTITQQLVRNLYTGGSQRTFQHKIKEACLAIKLAAKLPKQQILEEYLNTVYYGNHAYGVQAAAETYFSKPAAELNLRQAALIAGLPQAPSVDDPFHDPQAAVARRNEVLQAMLSTGTITPEQERWAAKGTNLGLKPGRIYTRIREPYFFSYVIDQLQQAYGANTVREGGLRVYTTINPKLQAAADSAIRDALYEPNDPAAAVVSVVPGTGAIRAMTAVIPGNTTNQFNLTSQSAREAGSTFKVFVLAAAIEQGIDPDTTYYDSAPYTCTATICLTNGQPWQVTTYEHTYTGWTSITRATLSSDNTVYAQLTLDVGPQNVWNMATRLGVHLTQPAVASIGLGPLSVSPLDMAAAYATFASGGIYAKPRAITRVTFPDGKVDTSWNKPQTKRVLSAGVAWKVNDILEQNALYGTGYGSSDGIHPNAGKTGTTEDHADGWFDGYTRDLSTSVWMGYPQGEIPMLDVHGYEVAGATFAVPIWHQYMAVAEAKLPPRPFLVPKQLPVFHPFTPGNYGYVAQLSTSTTTTTTPAPVKPPKIVTNEAPPRRSIPTRAP